MRNKLRVIHLSFSQPQFSMIEFEFAPEFLQVCCKDFSSLKDRGDSQKLYQFYLNSYKSLDLLQQFIELLKNGTSERDILQKFSYFQINFFLHDWYKKLLQDNLIFFKWQQEEKILLSIYPVVANFQWRKPSQGFLLSNFAYFHRQGKTFVLESPEAIGQITDICPSVAMRIFASAQDENLLNSDPLCEKLFYLLDITGFLEPSINKPMAKFWEFHDFLFHDSSTINRVDDSFAATYRFADEQPYPPEHQTNLEASRIYLTRPKDELLDSEFYQILHQRRSSRSHSSRAIAIEQLSVLLFSSLRVIEKHKHYPQEIQSLKFKEIDIYRKNYPSAGGIHELRFYLIINKCDGISSGIYLYDDMNHALIYLSQSSKYLQIPLNNASYYWGKPGSKPQVLILITSRIDLLSWKYEKIAYRLTLLNAGCVIQTLYLVATKLNLACCALGAVNGLFWHNLASFDEIEGVPIAKVALGR